MSFCNSTSCQQEVNGAKIQLFAQQLKYFKHFFSLKVLFFYQNGNFEHFLLKNVHHVQQAFEHFSAVVTSIFREIFHAIALIINIHTPQETILLHFLQKNSQFTQNTRNVILLK